MGNLVPLAAGIIAAGSLASFGFLYASFGFLLVSWIGIDRAGFFQNRQIRKELQDRTGKDGILIGFVADIPAGPLDAHSELGLLKIDENGLTIFTEDRTLSFPKPIKTDRKFNVHALIGLGGWIRLTFTDSRHLLIESRERDTMWRSKMHTSELFKTLQSVWLAVDSAESQSE